MDSSVDVKAILRVNVADHYTRLASAMDDEKLIDGNLANFVNTVTFTDLMAI